MMTTMKSVAGTLVALTAFAALTLAAPAQQTGDPDATASAVEGAEDTEATAAEPVDTPFVRAHDIAMARIGQSLSHDHVATLNLLAYAAVASSLCADLEMDEGRVYAALTEASHDHFDAAPASEVEAHKDFSLIAFGVLTGLMLEDAVAGEADYCAEAVTYAQEIGDESFLQQSGEAVLYEPEGN